MTTATYLPSQLAGFGGYGPEQLGVPLQAQAGVANPFIQANPGVFAPNPGGQVPGTTPFGGIMPLSANVPVFDGQQYNRVTQQQPYPQVGTGWQSWQGQVSAAQTAMLGAVLWLQQQISQQLTAMIALTQQALHLQHQMPGQVVPFGGTGQIGTGQFGAGQIGGGQYGTGQFGANQFGGYQFGANQFGTGQFGRSALPY